MKTVFYSDKITEVKKEEGKPEKTQPRAIELTELQIIDNAEGLKIVAIPKPGQDTKGIFSVTIAKPLNYHDVIEPTE